MNGPIGMELFLDDHGRPWVVRKGKDDEGTTVYQLLAVTFTHESVHDRKYKAIAAAKEVKGP